MDKSVAEILYMRAKLDSTRDPYRLQAARLVFAYHAQEAYTFEEWCGRVGIALGDAVESDDGEANGKAALTAFAAIASSQAKSPIKIEHHEPRNEEPLSNLQVPVLDVKAHMNELAKQAEANKQRMIEKAKQA